MSGILLWMGACCTVKGVTVLSADEPVRWVPEFAIVIDALLAKWTVMDPAWRMTTTAPKSRTVRIAGKPFGRMFVRAIFPEAIQTITACHWRSRRSDGAVHGIWDIWGKRYIYIYQRESLLLPLFFSSSNLMMFSCFCCGLLLRFSDFSA